MAEGLESARLTSEACTKTVAPIMMPTASAAAWERPRSLGSGEKAFTQFVPAGMADGRIAQNRSGEGGFEAPQRQRALIAAEAVPFGGDDPERYGVGAQPDGGFEIERLRLDAAIHKQQLALVDVEKMEQAGATRSAAGAGELPAAGEGVQQARLADIGAPQQRDLRRTLPGQIAERAATLDEFNLPSRA